MADQLQVGSPEWWVKRLDERMRARDAAIRLHQDYYEGKHRLAFATEAFRTAFGRLFSAFADNWCELVVDAVEERLNVEGFRLGDDTKGDKAAWDIWQRNQLDADSQIAHTEALIAGESYVLVWMEGPERKALITVEHPLQMIVESEAGYRRRRRAALKKWQDDDGHLLATLYLPEGLYKFRSEGKVDPNADLGEVRWLQREVKNEEWPVVNPLKVVPVVPLANRPRLLKPGRSEIATVVPKQDAVNKLIADMMVASEYGALPQRYATGLELETDPETNQVIAPFKKYLDRLWTVEDDQVKFGEFTQTQLENFVKAIEMLVQHIASQTRTPPHYFYLSGQFPSGESIKAAETGLVAKTRRKMRHFGEGWEEVMRLGFLAEDDEQKAQATNSETMWGDPESRSESEHVDAVMKMQKLGVPQEALWEELGFSPTQISRFKQMRTQEALEIGMAFDPFALNGNGREPSEEPAEEPVG